jgi:broad specificity phosphatase PhoE
VKRPALYIRGRIVIGNSHCAAFEQLSSDERHDSISSGVFDTETGEFQGYVEEEHFYEKEILLMRHASVADDSIDPGISQDGVSQVKSVIPYLQKLDLSKFTCKCSPMLRCLETADIIQKILNIKFSVDPSLVEPPPYLKYEEEFYIPARVVDFPQYLWPETNGWVINNHDFVGRVADVLRHLPKRSIIISHGGFVSSMVKLALCEDTMLRCGIPTASLTHIQNREVRCLGKVL